MTIKSTILAAGTAIALVAAAPLAVTPLSAEPKERLFEKSAKPLPPPTWRLGRRIAKPKQHPRIARITARGAASNRGPLALKRYYARRAALSLWSAKVAQRYGGSYTSWTAARDKQVTCETVGDRVFCQVSARPATPFERIGLGF